MKLNVNTVHTVLHLYIQLLHWHERYKTFQETILSSENVGNITLYTLPYTIHRNAVTIPTTLMYIVNSAQEKHNWRFKMIYLVLILLAYEVKVHSIVMGIVKRKLCSRYRCKAFSQLIGDFLNVMEKHTPLKVHLRELEGRCFVNNVFGLLLVTRSPAFSLQMLKNSH